jgi:hypothetical protein
MQKSAKHQNVRSNVILWFLSDLVFIFADLQKTLKLTRKFFSNQIRNIRKQDKKVRYTI